MKKYNVMIEETVWQTFEVEADTQEEAKEIAAQKYREAEFVLEPGNLAATRMHIVDEHNCTVADDDWEEI